MSLAVTFSDKSREENMINVLFTCAGRRNYLIDYFRRALRGRGQVFAADASSTAPALQEADRSFIVPAVSEEGYIDALLKICREYQVSLVFSLNDLELPLLSRNSKQFSEVGTMPVVSSEKVVDLCFDKWATHEFLRGIGVNTPRTYLSIDEARRAISLGELSFPVVVKPRWGTASIGIEYPASMEELELAWRLGTIRLKRTFLADISSLDPDRCLLIQEYLNGHEYGLDIVNDLDGEHACTFIKRKLGMRAGETDRAVTVSHEGLEKIGAKIGKALGHVGNLDCDAFIEGENCYVLELNARFGGGYPFSHAAGANLPAAIVAWATGEKVIPTWLTFQTGIAHGKCDRLVNVSLRQEPAEISLPSEEKAVIAPLPVRIEL
jgi:carbamoyl-phosphate synthase large subunit